MGQIAEILLSMVLLACPPNLEPLSDEYKQRLLRMRLSTGWVDAGAATIGIEGTILEILREGKNWGFSLMTLMTYMLMAPPCL
jgi:hypothetical protein